ncbi:flagellin N-terminal helical domain-containing protein [Flavimaricola marinus]|uniref:Flagellin n=1 Tax=Flavimaricola marinus TaxID=1819565 RepID=A0A238LF78_9RHOB|nr:flagellin [Flavimaricola marinus]SMY08242.1 Flagellin [Flavimaricola marinus]
MSSILTNNGAMVALQTLKSINKDMASTQNLISTGKAVSSAKDNSAIWAISKVMESDVSGFKAISSSLSLGQSTASVARQASETVTDLLTQMKEKIVASQEENVDREKIQTDIAALRDQIGAVVGAAQFNGLNLLENSSNTAGTGSINVLSSLDRSGSGVAASEINVTKQDLGTSSGTMATAGGAAGPTSAAAAGIVAGATQANAFTVTTALATQGSTIQISQIAGTALGAGNQIIVGVREGDTQTDVANNMVTALNFAADKLGINGTYSLNATTAGQIDFTNDNETGGATISLTAADVTSYAITTPATANGNVGGGLALLDQFDVTTSNGADAALGAIEGMIQTSINAAASFGSAQGRIDTQMDFVSGLTDALKSGIGSLVDADMEEASARLQALQVQQQLGVQALSIANQAPQTILSLFR